MKVLHINTYDSYGGAEKIAYTLYSHQKSATLLVKEKLKYTDDSNIIEFPSLLSDKLTLLTDKILWKFGLRKGVKTYFQAGDQLNLTYAKLRKLTAYQEADIIHLHNIHGSYFDLSALELIGREKKIVWTMHDMWPFTGGEAYTLEERDLVSTSSLHKEQVHHYPLNKPVLDRRKYFLKQKKRIYSLISHNICFVAVSSWVESSLRKSLVYRNGLQIEKIYNGLDVRKFQNHKQRHWNVPRVLFFNSGSPFKGSELFIECLGRTSSRFDLIVVGNEISQNIKDTIKVSYEPRIEDEEKLAALFNSADILVFPSVSEAFGLLPAEAMLCGVLVISSDAGGLKELVLHENTGLVFKNGNSADLLLKLETAVAGLEKFKTIGERSREYVVENFSLELMLASYEELYNRVMKGPL